MSDVLTRTLEALQSLIPPDLDHEALRTWKLAGAAALAAQGPGEAPPSEADPAHSANDFRLLDGMDARAEAELVSAVMLAAINYSHREG